MNNVGAAFLCGSQECPDREGFDDKLGAEVEIYFLHVVIESYLAQNRASRSWMVDEAVGFPHRVSPGSCLGGTLKTPADNLLEMPVIAVIAIGRITFVQTSGCQSCVGGASFVIGVGCVGFQACSIEPV